MFPNTFIVATNSSAFKVFTCVSKLLFKKLKDNLNFRQPYVKEA